MYISPKPSEIMLGFFLLFIKFIGVPLNSPKNLKTCKILEYPKLHLKKSMKSYIFGRLPLSLGVYEATKKEGLA